MGNYPLSTPYSPQWETIPYLPLIPHNGKLSLIYPLFPTMGNYPLSTPYSPQWVTIPYLPLIPPQWVTIPYAMGHEAVQPILDTMTLDPSRLINPNATWLGVFPEGRWIGNWMDNAALLVFGGIPWQVGHACVRLGAPERWCVCRGANQSK